MGWIIENKHYWLISGLIGYGVTLLFIIIMLIRVSQLQKLESFLDALFQDRLLDVLSDSVVYIGTYSTISLIIYFTLEIIIRVKLV